MLEGRIEVGWYKQADGQYWLKAITVYCPGVDGEWHVYDSNGTFRDEDARRVSELLGAEVAIETERYNATGDTSDYPGWAEDTPPKEANHAHPE